MVFYATIFPLLTTPSIFHSLGTRTSYILTKLEWGLDRKQHSIYLFVGEPFLTMQLKGPALEFESLGRVQECKLNTLNWAQSGLKRNEVNEVFNRTRCEKSVV